MRNHTIVLSPRMFYLLVFVIVIYQYYNAFILPFLENNFFLIKPLTIYTRRLIIQKYLLEEQICPFAGVRMNNNIYERGYIQREGILLIALSVAMNAANFSPSAVLCCACDSVNLLSLRFSIESLASVTLAWVDCLSQGRRRGILWWLVTP
jgi:hypothetical protein